MPREAIMPLAVYLLEPIIGRLVLRLNVDHGSAKAASSDD